MKFLSCKQNNTTVGGFGVFVREWEDKMTRESLGAGNVRNVNKAHNLQIRIDFLMDFFKLLHPVLCDKKDIANSPWQLLMLPTFTT